MDKRLLNEIEHGKYLKEHGAGEVWNWETPAGNLRWQRRVKMLCSVINNNDVVLEVGCGTGYFTKELVKTKALITAIDISTDLINEAINTIKEPNVNFLIENAYQMTFTDNSFDRVVGSSVLHHLDVDKAIAEIYRVLKPGGKISFTEPNMMNPQIALQKNIPYIKRKSGDSPDETAFYRWVIKKKLSNAGFKLIEIKPFDFLHPQTPKSLVKSVNKFSRVLEKTPIISEIAGSIFIKAEK
jgi:ubiquinone/menaquinone biosynthesis C-methylase UbiE